MLLGIGMTMVAKAKLDSKGEPYDPNYYGKKMVVLGKAEPAEYRPDDVTKKVTDQFCVLSEEGLDIQSAQITTRGETAADSFYVRTAEGKKLTDAAAMRSIRLKLKDALGVRE
jgi:hypothetical protein